ncbi:MAG TPA: glycosyltransferase family 39 protein [Vulgatibacter sp.]|nr:glycosyltransferase family 39 protein [Vulgatibacter sp.]
MRLAPRLPSRTALRARAHLIAAVALGGMACLLVHAALTESPTYDEPSHVVRGLAYLSTGDARLSFGHPPLGNLVQGIPGWLLDRPLDFRSLPGWDTWDVGRIARTLMSRDYERVRTAIVGGRMMTSLLTVLLGAYLYRFCLRWGRLRAALTVGLYACFPLFLAHGHLATTDMPLTVATTVAIGEFVRWLEGRSWIRFLTFSVAAGAAFATKFNGLFLVPVLGLAGLVVALRGGGPFAHPALHARLLRLGAFVAVATAVAVLVVNAAYRFQRTGWPVERILARDEPHNWLTVPYDDEMMEELSLLPSLPARMPIPLPYPWVFGLHTIRAQNERSHGGWFFGEQRTSALYFPLLSVIKTPAAVLSLLLVGAVVVLRRRRLPRPSTLALWIAPALLLGVSLFSEIQIGVRHLLPIFPPLVIGAGWAATLLGAVARIPVAVVLVAAAAEALASAPAYIGHFSSAIGGSKPGHRISIIAEDWGQDVRRLATFVKERRLEPLYYLPYGSAAPMEMKRFGATFRRFDCKTQVRGPAWIAVHAAHAVRFKKPCGPISLDREPDLVLAEHVWLYRIDPPERPDEPAPPVSEAQAGEGARAAGEAPADPSGGPAP